MAKIEPFCGIRYDKGRDLSTVAAPPYDVLTAEDKQKLLERDPNNIVAIDLPHLPPKTAGPDEKYRQAADRLNKWLASGTLVTENAPAFYAYEQAFTHAGRTYHRRGLIARVRLEPFGEGHIFPHEQTYPGPIEDRLKLTRATRCNLSQVFGLYPDAENAVRDALGDWDAGPDFEAELEDVKHRVRIVKDPDRCRKITELMAPKAIFIADGHHRYTTSLHYRDELLGAGGIDENHPANFVSMTLVSLADPGLIILPTHRVFKGLRNWDVERFLSLISETFQSKPIADTTPESLEAELAQAEPRGMILLDATTRRAFSIAPSDPNLLDALEPDRTLQWRQLDVAILQRALVDEVLTPNFAPESLEVHYPHQVPEAVASLDAGFQAAFLMQPTPIEAVEAICRAGERMPQKSTFFFPKLATGLVINPLC